MQYKVRKYFPSGSYVDYWLDGNKKIGKYFTVSELANKSAKEEVKLELYPESEQFIIMLDELRGKLGSIPVTSAYRTKTWNASIGGDKNSAHLRCCAIDFPLSVNKDRTKVRDAWKAICKAHGVKGAINYYNTYYHIEAFSDKWYGQSSAFIVRDKR